MFPSLYSNVEYTHSCVTSLGMVYHKPGCFEFVSAAFLVSTAYIAAT